jgi:hypothetical protein
MYSKNGRVKGYEDFVGFEYCAEEDYVTPMRERVLGAVLLSSAGVGYFCLFLNWLAR